MEMAFIRWVSQINLTVIKYKLETFVSVFYKFFTPAKLHERFEMITDSDIYLRMAMKLVKWIKYLLLSFTGSSSKLNSYEMRL